jgi:CRISPR-associated Cas5-like protein
MKPYPLQLEISGPTALCARPDTGSSPVSYVAPTFSAAKGIFESILRWNSVNVRQTRCDICAPVQLYLNSSALRDVTAPWANESRVIPAFLEVLTDQLQDASSGRLNRR